MTVRPAAAARSRATRSTSPRARSFPVRSSAARPYHRARGRPGQAATRLRVGAPIAPRSSAARTTTGRQRDSAEHRTSAARRPPRAPKSIAQRRPGSRRGCGWGTCPLTCPQGAFFAALLHSAGCAPEDPAARRLPSSRGAAPIEQRIDTAPWPSAVPAVVDLGRALGRHGREAPASSGCTPACVTNQSPHAKAACGHPLAASVASAARPPPAGSLSIRSS